MIIIIHLIIYIKTRHLKVKIKYNYGAQSLLRIILVT